MINTLLLSSVWSSIGVKSSHVLQCLEALFSTIHEFTISMRSIPKCERAIIVNTEPLLLESQNKLDVLKFLYSEYHSVNDVFFPNFQFKLR